MVPDGAWIAFTRRTDHADIYVMREDGWVSGASEARRAWPTTAAHVAAITRLEAPPSVDGSRIVELLRTRPLIDGHNDLLWALREARGGGGTEPTSREPRRSCMTDMPRLEAGGLGAQFWSVYVPSDLPGRRGGHADARADRRVLRLLNATRTGSSRRAPRMTSSAIARDGQGRVDDRGRGRPFDRELARGAAHPRAARRRLHDAHPQRRHALGGLGHRRAPHGGLTRSARRSSAR